MQFRGNRCRPLVLYNSTLTKLIAEFWECGNITNKSKKGKIPVPRLSVVTSITVCRSAFLFNFN